MTKLIEVACAIIWHDGKIFSAKRRSDQFPPNVWEFPGGKLEAGETPSHAIVREIYEELNMDVTALEDLPYYDYDYGRFAVRLFPVICETQSTDFHVKEHADARWLTPEECRGLQWAPADIPILNEHVFLGR